MAVRCNVQKSRPSSNIKVKGQTGQKAKKVRHFVRESSSGRGPRRRGPPRVLRRWENQRMLSIVLLVALICTNVRYFVLVMVALCNRADHYISSCFFLLSSLWSPYVIGRPYIFMLWFVLLSLWSPYVIGQTIIFLPCDFYLLSSSSSSSSSFIFLT